VSDAVEGKGGVRVHQVQQMKVQEGTGDPGGPDPKTARSWSGSGLCPSGEKAFFADVSREAIELTPELSRVRWHSVRCQVSRVAAGY